MRITTPRLHKLALLRRAQRLGEEPCCAICKRTEEDLPVRYDKLGCDRDSLEADHIIELADGGCYWSIFNLQLLCYECHTKKTVASAKKRREREKAVA